MPRLEDSENCNKKYDPNSIKLVEVMNRCYKTAGRFLETNFIATPGKADSMLRYLRYAEGLASKRSRIVFAEVLKGTLAAQKRERRRLLSKHPLARRVKCVRADVFSNVLIPGGFSRVPRFVDATIGAGLDRLKWKFCDLLSTQAGEPHPSRFNRGLLIDFCWTYLRPVKIFQFLEEYYSIIDGELMSVNGSTGNDMLRKGRRIVLLDGSHIYEHKLRFRRRGWVKRTEAYSYMNGGHMFTLLTIYHKNKKRNRFGYKS